MTAFWIGYLAAALYFSYALIRWTVTS